MGWGDGLFKFALHKKLLTAILALAILPIVPLLTIAPAYAVGPAFTCDSSMYQVAGGLFYKLGIPGFVYAQVGSNAAVTGLNAIGYNPADNYIYGDSNATTLQQIASDGTITSPGSISGVTLTNTSGGDFLTNDQEVMVAANATLQLLTLNRSGGAGTPVTSGTVSNITLTGSGYTGAIDIGTMTGTGGTSYAYALAGQTLTVFTMASSSPTTATYTQKTVTGLQNTTTGSFGAQWVDPEGNFYAWDSIVTPSATTHALYEISATDLSSAATTIAANKLAETTIASATATDGAGCKTAPSAFAPQMTAAATISNITGTTASATGYLTTNSYPVNPNGNENNAKICYNTTGTTSTTPGATYGLLTGATCVSTSTTFAASTSQQSFTVPLTGLTPSTTYYYQVQATNTPGGTITPFLGYSTVQNFVTPGIPTFTSISPSSGSIAGGVTGVVITGTNFTGATSVTIDGIPVTSFVVNSATSITITTPAGTSLGAKNVVVTAPGGTATGPGAYTYLAVVTFNVNGGGTGSMPNQSGSSPAALTANAYTWSGSTFLGWNTAANGSGTAYANGATYPFTSSTTLYAQWLTVASVAPPTGPLTAGTAITITGTGFTGATGVTIGGVAATSVVVVNSTTITAVVPTSATVGAKDIVVTTPSGTGTGTGLFTYQATVTFNGNGSDGGSMSNQLASTATALTTNAFTRTGYTFSGWNTLANGTGTAYANSASFPFTADTTLYAQWTASNFNVIYNGNGSTSGTAPGTVAHATGSTVTVLGNTGTLAKTGSVWAGWNTAADGSGTTYQSGNTFTMPAANTTLYARWTAAPTVTSLTGGTGDVAGGNTVTITGTNFTGVTGVTIAGIAATGVTFVNTTTITAVVPHNTTGTNGTKSVLVTTPGGTNGANTLYTYTVTVSFNANGGTGSMANQTASAAANLTTDGFTPASGYSAAVPFWSTLPGGGGTTYANSASFAFNTASVDVTLYGQYTATSFNVVYNGNGSNGGAAPGTVAHATGSTVTVLGNTGSLTKTGAVWAGWNTAADGSGTTYQSGNTFTMPAAITTLYARWTAAPTVTSLTGGTGDVAGGNTVTITGTNFTGVTGVTINGVAATGVTFVNTTTITVVAPAGASTGAKSVLVTTPGGTNGANTLYTYTVTVTFNANGGTGSMANQTASVATALTTDGFTPATGYSAAVPFWSTLPGGGGTTYANTASFPFNTTTADLTL